MEKLQCLNGWVGLASLRRTWDPQQLFFKKMFETLRTDSLINTTKRWDVMRTCGKWLYQ